MRKRSAWSEAREWTVAGLSGFALAAAGILAVAVLTLIAVFAAAWVSNTTADSRGAASARNRIHGNGAYRIAAYEQFFGLCQQVQATEGAIQNDADELAGTTDPQRRLELTSAITALRNQRIDLITQYNADSTKSYTAAQFKDSGLPPRLDPTAKETQCTA